MWYLIVSIPDLCTLTYFKDVGLRDIAFESAFIAEGSIEAVLDDRQYNRVVRLHNIIYEALQRLIWK